jgi:hypothetical protein
MENGRPRLGTDLATATKKVGSNLVNTPTKQPRNSEKYKKNSHNLKIKKSEKVKIERVGQQESFGQI